MGKQDLRNLEGNVVWFKGYIRGSGWGRQEGVFNVGESHLREKNSVIFLVVMG